MMKVTVFVKMKHPDPERALDPPMDFGAAFVGLKKQQRTYGKSQAQSHL